MMKQVKALSKKELNEISEVIGEAFVTNELFHEFGPVDQRKEIVLRYMKPFVKCVYKSGQLYCSDDGDAFIGMAYSDEQPILPKLELLFVLLCRVPFGKLKKLLRYANQIGGGNREYTQHTYLEILMVCVKKDCQGKGLATQLVNYAKEMAAKRNVPVLFDTDMKAYTSMYQHLGCELYHTKTADNGVTRYNLVWKPDSLQ